MSRRRRIPDSGQHMEVADDAIPTKNMILTGLVRTSKGYALAIVEYAPDGSLVALRLGRSQADKVFVAMAHKEALVKASLAA